MTVPATGFYVEVDNPNTGHTWVADPLDDAQWLPALNAKPEVRIPVPPKDRWLAADFEGVEPTMRVWLDGQRLPIDELRTVEPGNSEVVLVGEGGKELDKPISREVDQEEAWLEARDTIQTETSYATNFDDPATDSEEILLQDIATESEFKTVLSQQATDAYQVVNGGVEPCQTCFTTEAEDSDSSSSPTTRSDGVYSSGTAATFGSSGQSRSWDFTTQYDIDPDDFDIAIRWTTNGSSTSSADVEWSIDGDVVSTYSPADGGTDEPDWESTIIAAESADGGLDSTLSAGSHSLTAEVIGTGTDDFVVDVVAPLDTRFNYTFDNTLDDGGALDGPQFYPDGPALDFADAETVRNVVGGRATTSFSSVDDGQQLALSNDRGKNYKTASNTETIDKSFAEAGASLRLQATLGRTGSQSVTPKTGIEPQCIDSYELYATVENSPVLENRRTEATVGEWLREIADYSNSLYELTYDESVPGIRVEWTRSGQRTGTADEAIVDYDIDKDLRVYKKATVRGSAQSRAGEQITANHGTAVGLDEDELVTAKESVRAASDGTLYENKVDYTVDYKNGSITTLSDGNIADGQSIIVDYLYEPVGTYEASDYDPSTDRALPSKKINSVTTQRQAEQGALVLQQNLDTPLVEATVTLSRADAQRSLIEAVQLSDLPTDVNLETQSVENSPEQVVLQLGSRDQIKEVIRDLEQRLGATEQRA
ncbi:hypothetical protein [Haloarcula sp. K1]|uniref:hypothetical protein n=1 Tax=Haloarcula sp. K1 TaxID=1622207 RepID=UPI0007BBD399|nr:hypothetical protein [Haloarcula sp. K1]KZX49303.1 hypothetical protein AV929_12220 [Haloarcula sp. K1]